MQNWINLARFGNIIDCLFVQSILELHEIEHLTKNQHTNNLIPQSTDLSDMIIIGVHISTYQKAKKILDTHEYGKYIIS